MRWIRLTTFEFERAVVTCQQASETNEHLPKRRMYIKVELALEIVASKLAEVRLVPYNNIGLANLVETRPAGEKCVDYRWYVLEILLDKLALCEGQRT